MNGGRKWVPNSLAHFKVPAARARTAYSGDTPEMGSGELRQPCMRPYGYVLGKLMHALASMDHSEPTGGLERSRGRRRKLDVNNGYGGEELNEEKMT